MPSDPVQAMVAKFPPDIYARLLAQNWPSVHQRLTELEGLQAKITRAQEVLQAQEEHDRTAYALARQQAVEALQAATARQESAYQDCQQERRKLQGERDLVAQQAKDFETLAATAERVRQDRRDLDADQLAVAADRGQVAREREKAKAELAAASLQLQDAIARDAKLRQREHDLKALDTKVATAQADVDTRVDAVKTLEAQAQVAKDEIAKYQATKQDALVLLAKAEQASRAAAEAEVKVRAQRGQLEELRTVLTKQKAEQETREGELASRQRELDHHELLAVGPPQGLPAPSATVAELPRKRTATK